MNIHICQFLIKFFIVYYRSSQSAFYKVLISNAATSALRLHQRLPQIQFTREFLALLLLEDSCHYLFFSLIFLYVQPFIVVLFPVVLFAVLHSASYSLKMLDVSIYMQQFDYVIAFLCGVKKKSHKLIIMFMTAFW